MRRIAIINQKGGVGKTTTAVNMGAALARAGRRVVVVDLDPQANATLHLGAELDPDEPSTYSVLCAGTALGDALRATGTPGLSLVPSHIDLSGAELELAAAMGRETLLRDAITDWVEASGAPPADYLLFDCPPSLGLLSVNGLVAAEEVIVVLQPEFFALQGLSKLLDVLKLLRRRLNPQLRLAGVLPCMYDGRLRLAREVLAEIKRYFADQVFATQIRTNVKLAEAPSHGQTIFEYDPTSAGAHDHSQLAQEVLAQEDGAAPKHLPEPETQGAAVPEQEAAAPSGELSSGPASEQGPSEELAPAAEAPPTGAAAREPLPAGEAQTPPAPHRALAPKSLGGYLGEDRDQMASQKGPWVGR